jgi:DUF1680 family protein
MLLTTSLALTLVSPSAALAAGSVEKLQEFPLDQVQITDKYQTGLFAKEITYLNTTIDADRLLSGFKAMSTGTTPSNLYGGWENSLIRGHTMGHWLSAMARAYQQTKGNDDTLNGQLKTKLDHVITLLKSYQQTNGFLFATPMDQFGAPEGQNVSSWVPWYTMHKILAGLVDVAKYEGSADALAVASKLGDWIYSRASGWDSSTRSRVLGMEYGGMNDALYDLYKLTSSANHLTAAHLFDETNLFTTTAAGTDTLSGKHANTTIPKFLGALNRYRALGTAEQSYFTAADQFLSIVLKNHTYVTGGNSQDEHFHAAGALDQYRDNVNNETCNAYNMSKLTHDLFKTTGDVKYANFYDKIHINEILSSMNPETGMTTYFKPMGTGYFKAFGTTDSSFWCCTGTGMENFTRLNDSVYFHDDKDLWVTFYVSSTLNWKDRGLALTQTTDLPSTNKVTFTITAAPTDAVNVQFRKPDWASTCQVAVAVNGQAVTPVEANGFLGVSRVWQANDTVTLAFPLFVQVSRLQDNQNAVAFTYGPLVLSAGLGIDSSMKTTTHAMTIAATSPGGLQDTITINSGTKIEDWLSNIQNNLVQTAGKLEFATKGTDSDSKLVFIPHYSRYKDRYGIYWKLAGTAGGTSSTAVTCPAVTAGGSGGAGGSAGGSGGSTGSGGAAGSSGKGGTSGGANGSGGAVSTGSGGTTEATSKGGAGGTNTGAGSATAGAGGTTAGTGGATAGSGGGAKGSGGSAQGSGGVAGVGGAAGGSAQGVGGATAGLGGNANGGTSHSDGGTGAGSGGRATGGTAGGPGGNAGQNGTGCSCNLGHATSTGHWLIGLLLGLGLVVRRRSRRR